MTKVYWCKSAKILPFFLRRKYKVSVKLFAFHPYLQSIPSYNRIRDVMPISRRKYSWRIVGMSVGQPREICLWSNCSRRRRRHRWMKKGVLEEKDKCRKHYRWRKNTRNEIKAGRNLSLIQLLMAAAASQWDEEGVWKKWTNAAKKLQMTQTPCRRISSREMLSMREMLSEKI